MFNSENRFVSKTLRVWLMTSCVGPPQKMIHRIKRLGYAMRTHAQHATGLAHGNFVRKLVDVMVRLNRRILLKSLLTFCYVFSYSQDNQNQLSEERSCVLITKRTPCPILVAMKLNVHRKLNCATHTYHTAATMKITTKTAI